MTKESCWTFAAAGAASDDGWFWHSEMDPVFHSAATFFHPKLCSSCQKGNGRAAIKIINYHKPCPLKSEWGGQSKVNRTLFLFFELIEMMSTMQTSFLEPSKNRWDRFADATKMLANITRSKLLVGGPLPASFWILFSFDVHWLITIDKFKMFKW